MNEIEQRVILIALRKLCEQGVRRATLGMAKNPREISYHDGRRSAFEMILASLGMAEPAEAAEFPNTTSEGGRHD